MSSSVCQFSQKASCEVVRAKDRVEPPVKPDPSDNKREPEGTNKLESSK